MGGNGSLIGAFAGGNPTNHLASGQFYFTDPNITQTSTDELLVSDGFNLVKVVVQWFLNFWVNSRYLVNVMFAYW